MFYLYKFFEGKILVVIQDISKLLENISSWTIVGTKFCIQSCVKRSNGILDDAFYVILKKPLVHVQPNIWFQFACIKILSNSIVEKNVSDTTMFFCVCWVNLLMSVATHYNVFLWNSTVLWSIYMLWIASERHFAFLLWAISNIQ